jgi:hypothetical protein
MARMMEIGVILPSVAVQRSEHLDLRSAARYVEDAGLDSVWMGDHLATDVATVDATIGLATAAAVTDRVAMGVSVYVPAIRPLAWAAKQVASLQYVSGERVILGIGLVGMPRPARVTPYCVLVARTGGRRLSTWQPYARWSDRAAGGRRSRHCPIGTTGSGILVTCE